LFETHDELDVEPDAVLSVVSEPDRRIPGRAPGEEWFFAQDVGPSRWLKVVVHYEHGVGRIATAFPRRTFP